MTRFNPSEESSSACIVERAISFYPDELREQQKADLKRLAFQLEIIRRRVPSGGKILDVGGGIGAFSPALAISGFDTTLADDFRDPINSEFPCNRVGVHERLGVKVVKVDASSASFSPEPESFDAITCIDSIEHWHRSPKAALHKMVTALKPGRLLMIGMPNCVNLRKRITAPLGRNKWSSMESWYEQSEFRSHVREPDVADLVYMARDLRLQNVTVIGRNWAGRTSKSFWLRIAARSADLILRLRPSLCSDLYLMGTRAEN